MDPRTNQRMTPIRSRSWVRASRPLLAVCACGALVAACSSSPEVATAPSTTGAPTTAPPTTVAATTTTAPPAIYPLRGTPLDDPAKGRRPALVVKIDNVDQYSRPQAGINDADIVWEEKIEGPISRFAAVFQAKDPEDIGPVRSGRSTDVAIVSTLNHPLYAFSGANDVFLKLLREAPLVDIGYSNHAQSYDRRPNRTAPDNVFTSTARLRAMTNDGAVPPPPQFTYRTADAAFPSGAVDVKSLAYDFGLGPVGQPVTFAWNAGTKSWDRTQKGTPDVDVAGAVISPTNVIVRFTPYHDTGLVDKSNTPVPEADIVGTGDAWVFIDGKAIKATWSKPDAATITTYTAADGTPIAIDPGQTWIGLVPTGGNNFSVTKTDGTPLT